MQLSKGINKVLRVSEKEVILYPDLQDRVTSGYEIRKDEQQKCAS